MDYATLGIGAVFGFVVGFIVARFYFQSEAEKELEFIDRGRRDDRGDY